VTTGRGSDGTQTTSEIVDLTVKGNNKCNNWPHFPIDVYGATGGLIGDTVIICGGYDDSGYIDECYSLTSEKATLVTHMSVGRGFPASIVLNDNTLWVTGGGYGGEYFASTEYVKTSGALPGPDLPIALRDHAMVAINRTCSLVIGGLSSGGELSSGGTSASTFFYDHNEGEWTTGPSLMQARYDLAAGTGPSLMQARFDHAEGRYHHAVGIVTDEVTDENFVAVTGGLGSGYVDLDSTEILQDGNWVQGNINDALCICYLFGKLTVSEYFYRLIAIAKCF
jgi:hypothetical protein